MDRIFRVVLYPPKAYRWAGEGFGFGIEERCTGDRGETVWESVEDEKFGFSSMEEAFQAGIEALGKAKS